MRSFALRPSLAGALLAGLFTAGCAMDRGVETEVTRFHDLAPPQGQSVAVVPEQEAMRGPEFQAYQSIVEQWLRTVGYQVAQSPQTADLLAEIDYQVGEPQTDTDIRWDGPYSAYWFNRGNFYPYSYGWYLGAAPYPGMARARTITRYPRMLQMEIIDPDVAGTAEVVFEGRVYSLGRTRELSQVMPYLVAGMFANFPGESGVTKVVTIEGDGMPRPSTGNGYERRDGSARG